MSRRPPTSPSDLPAPPQLRISLESILRMQPALRELYNAHEYANALHGQLWDFAVEFRSLRALGLTNTDLRCLLSQGFARHAVEVPSSGKARRAFRPVAGLRIPPRTCVVLTHTGGLWLRGLLTSSPAPGRADLDQPRWDGQLRELRLGTHVVKRFRQPAPDQQLVLAAFEEEGWPPSILDPLPPQAGQDAKARLRQTIANLNRWQKRPGLHFSGNGEGKTICWARID
jgi:hypothetical protein